MKRRELIVLCVLVAAAAAAVLWWLQPSLASAVEEHGGSFVFEPETPEGPVTSVVFIVAKALRRDLHDPQEIFASIWIAQKIQVHCGHPDCWMIEATASVVLPL